jgi:two-component system, chemotaxis family, chemotaxis protein CheY
MNPALSVLIVDDNTKMRSMIAEIIRNRASKIVECSDGMDALGEYSLHRPDWVLMDAKMNNMDGIRATELIHRFFPKAKVMIVSQDDNPEMRKAAQYAGANAFVSKENLLDILKNFQL